MKTNKIKLNILLMTLVIFTSFFAFKMDVRAYISFNYGATVNGSNVSVYSPLYKAVKIKENLIDRKDNISCNLHGLSDYIEVYEDGKKLYLKTKNYGNLKEKISANITCSENTTHSATSWAHTVTLNPVRTFTAKLKLGEYFKMSEKIEEVSGLKWSDPFNGDFDNALLWDENKNAILNWNKILTQHNQSNFYTATKVGTASGYIYKGNDVIAKIDIVVEANYEDVHIYKDNLFRVSNSKSISSLSNQCYISGANKNIVNTSEFSAGGNSFALNGVMLNSTPCNIVASHSDGTQTIYRVYVHESNYSTKVGETILAPIYDTFSTLKNQCSESDIVDTYIYNGSVSITGTKEGNCTYQFRTVYDNIVSYKITILPAESSDPQKGNINFYNLNGSTLNYGSVPFENCRYYGTNSNYAYCDYRVGVNSYDLPTASTNSRYGKFLGWTLKTPEEYCSGSDKKLLSGKFSSNEKKSWIYYAIFNNTCGSTGGGGRNPSADVPGGSDDTSDIIGEIGPDGLCNYYKVHTHPTYSPYVGDSRQKAAIYKTVTQNRDVNLYLYQGQDICNNNLYTAICYDPNKRAPNDTVYYEKGAYVNPFDDIIAFPGTGITSYSAANVSKGAEAFVLNFVQKKQYYKDLDGDGNLVSEKVYLVAAQIAIRTLLYGEFNSSGSAVYRSLYCAWANDPGCANIASDWVPNPSSDSEAQSALEIAKKMWQDGRGPAAECIINGNCNFNNLKNIGFEFGEPTKSCDEENGQKKLVYTGTVTGLNTYYGDDDIRLKTLACPTGYTCKFYIDGRRINTGETLRNAGTNFKFEVIGDICSAPEDAKFGIEVEHYNAEDWHNVIVITPRNSSYQRMLLIFEGQKIKTDIVFGDKSDSTTCNCTISNCYTSPELTPGNASFDVERFAQVCCSEIRDSHADDYALYCESCTSVVWNRICEEPNPIGDAAEVNGPNETFYIKEALKNNQTNYKCVLNTSTGIASSDAAQNPYEIIGPNLEGAKNRYCTVACKEDWEFDLPTYKAAVSGTNAEFVGDYIYTKANTGRYFILGIDRIQGKKTCITSNIKINNFSTDLNNLNNSILDAYNNYAKYKAIADAYNSVKNSEDANQQAFRDTISCDYGGGYCHRAPEDADEEDTVQCSETTERCTTVTWPTGTRTGITGNRYILVPANTYAYTTYYLENGVMKSKTNNYVPYEKYGSSSCANASPCSTDGSEITVGGTDYATDFKNKNGEYDENGNYISYVDKWKNHYNSLVAQRNAIVNEYQTCSNYKNNDETYKWNPEIQYNYSDTNLYDPSTKQALDPNNYMVIDQMKPTIIEEKYFSSNVNNVTYTCNTANCQSNTSHTKEFNYYECNLTTGCSLQKPRYSNNTNVMKTITKAASFRIKGTWYVEDHTGNIKYSPDGNSPGDQYSVLDASERGKVLPIANESTRSHTYDNELGLSTYMFSFAKIGQYQNGTETGRLMGGIDGEGTNSVAKSLNIGMDDGQDIGKKVIYKCTYDVVEDSKCIGVDIDLTIETIEICPEGNCTRPVSYSLTSGKGVSYFPRSVSLNDMNPNNRVLGGNWSNSKGQKTLEEIEKDGNTIYEKPQYSYTLTPSGIAAIRNDAGNYNEINLICDDAQVRCESTYLPLLESKIGVTVNVKPSDDLDKKFTYYPGTTLAWK